MFSYLGLALIYLGTMRSLLPMHAVTITHTDLKTPPPTRTSVRITPQRRTFITCELIKFMMNLMFVFVIYINNNSLR